ncbi:glycosyltransferase involved in cell wall biosynthesis [Thermocatellispora tengchongensis]|uniref:Glycosyltransferase involved in cell wall biosynthesis n=1 Tax=Thermocatellispora tengchongensis TaxID=1073253 RepID=A0A840P8E4_9ACTN|nr:glycosyltransferase [Thermocatellispora tengchongensis]MBB5134131.1 glycosyltransferase involved in cell wall biosynthesis [Thermocatellispora tengchongensis]
MIHDQKAPSVGVVIPTGGRRPALLRAATAAVLAQAYPGPIDVVIVTDGAAPEAAPEVVAEQVADVVAAATAARLLDGAGGWLDAARSSPGAGGPRPWGVAPQEFGGSGRWFGVAGAGPDAARGPGHGPGGPRVVRVLGNRLSPGLPGARNTGIAALDTELVAFCDDDDEWLPGKLAAQVAALGDRPGAEFASCGIEVEYLGRRTARVAGRDTVTARDLARSRMVMVHSSTFLFRRGGLWADESAPNGQNEDWDLALRAAKRQPIVNVDRPLVRVRWGGSEYATRWGDRIAGLEWMLARHADLAVDPRGAARIYGQLAFLHAATGRRREAVRWAGRAFASWAGEPRAPIALAVAAGLVPASAVLGLLHTWGHGI